MLNVSPYIVVDDVKESLQYYQGIFGGEIHILNEQQQRVLHAELHLGESFLHFSDTYGRTPKSENLRLMMQFDREEELQAVYEALKADGEVLVELQDTFFGALHGQVKDRKNGVIWVLNYMK
ncbi:VOC family protein [Bacillus sp. 179-C3.3 HS]|uniref:VOC family protein n=1 Tax=Bacillus sp. 179-C3.3 HS TaxID=3232162 RepID=UPI0039A2B934